MLMQIRGKVRQTECTVALNLRFPLNSGCKTEELLLAKLAGTSHLKDNIGGSIAQKSRLGILFQLLSQSS